MPHYLSLSHSHFGSDPRPLRCINLLRHYGEMTVCCRPPKDPRGLAGLTFIPYMPTHRSLREKMLHGAQLLTGQFEDFIWNAEMRQMLQALHTQRFDAIICHTLTLLPLACTLVKLGRGHRTRVLFDAREYYPRQYENSWYWRIVWQRFNDYLCRQYLSKTDVVFTVSPGLAAGYKNVYGVDCRLLPSTSPWQDLQPHPTGSQNIRLIHHGAAFPGRRLEDTIDAIALADTRFTLDLMLVYDDAAYYESLRRRATETSRINFLTPVPLTKIVSKISNYDIGIFFLHDNTFNHRHVLPNKLFEFIQARLGVVVSPVPDMATLVQENKIGRVSPDFSRKSFAETLNGLTDEAIDTFKANANIAAKKFCWENSSQVILDALKN